MMRLSGAIRSKSKWYEKLNDAMIRKQWKDDARKENLLTEKQIGYVLAELDSK